MPPSERSLLKISELARQSGVPVATIKHYLREGLLPEPARRTGRNMSYYDPALVERVRTIKRLQQQQYLPLSLIKEVLEDTGDSADDLTTRAAISRVLARSRPDESRSRAELVLSGVKASDLDWLRSLALVSPKGREERYSGDDLTLLRLLGAARKAGLEPEMLPPSILADYARAIRELVRTELALFRAGVAPRAGARLGALAEVAATLSEELVVLLRRKLLLPTLKELESERRRGARVPKPKGVPQARSRRARP